jgi:glycosyltransferase involved in cell wall biosynthesis
VIITTRNRAPLLRDAIESVLAARSDRYELDLVVVNDGSTDETERVLGDYSCRVIRTTGIGMARARNEGLRAARGDFVTLLDDDDVWLPENIVTQLDVFEQHPEYGAVHAQSQLVHFDKSPFGEPVPKGPLPSGWIFEELLGYFPQVATILTRASVAREAGDLDPNLTGDTDWDWLLRIARKYPIGRVEKAVMLFRQREDKPDEELAWKRFPATIRIFRQHTRELAVWQRIRLERTLWRHRGGWSWGFLQLARAHRTRGDRERARRSMYYAVRASLPHAVVAVIRDWSQAK